MKRTLLVAATALALSAPAVPRAHAEPTGQWMDTRHQIALGDLPDSSELVARLGYAKHACRVKTGQSPGMPTPATLACLKVAGFIWVYDSPAQIAARKKATERVQPQVVIEPAPPAIDFMPHGCNGFIGGGGGFSMNCN